MATTDFILIGAIIICISSVVISILAFTKNNKKLEHDANGDVDLNEGSIDHYLESGDGIDYMNNFFKDTRFLDKCTNLVRRSDDIDIEFQGVDYPDEIPEILSDAFCKGAEDKDNCEKTKIRPFFNRCNFPYWIDIASKCTKETGGNWNCNTYSNDEEEEITKNALSKRYKGASSKCGWDANVNSINFSLPTII